MNDVPTPTRIAARVRRIKPSPSTAAADRANSLRQAGRSIVNLVVGEPDFDTPAHIRAAATAAMDQGQTRYTLMAGTVELRRAIAAKLERENGLQYEMNEHHRHQRSEERHLHRPGGDAGARRRGDRARALLGVLPRHGAGQ